MPTTTLTYTAQVGTDFAIAVGRELNLADGNNVPRVATATECKQWLVDQARALMQRQDIMAKREAVVAAAPAVFT